MGIDYKQMRLYRNLYKRVHDWARVHVPKPDHCRRCGEEKPLELSNNSHEYKIEIQDWEWICHKCHGDKDRWGKGVPKSPDHKTKIGKANRVAVKKFYTNHPGWLTDGVFTQGHNRTAMSDEHKEKIRQANRGHVPWNKGKTVGPYGRERMEKLWRATRGRPAWNRGLKASEETRRKLSESHKGHTAWNKGLHLANFR